MPPGRFLIIGLILVLGSCHRAGESDLTGADKSKTNVSPPEVESRGTPSTSGVVGAPPSEKVEGEDERFLRERERMVAQLETFADDTSITDRRVLQALRTVPRHEFVPQEFRDQSYHNTPLPIPESQTISQPYIVALMTQLLELDGTEKVLEVGTGSGYQAAVLGELAAEVYTVEIRPALLEAAKKKLEELQGRGTLHYKKLVAVVGDGSKGYEPAAPYDAIIVTAAPSKVPVWLLNQLKPGGRLVIPVGGDYIQELQLILKKDDGTYVEQPIVPVRFVPLVNGSAGRR